MDIVVRTASELSAYLTGVGVSPGDNLLLVGGTFYGYFVSVMIGGVGFPITVKPYHNGHVIIDGAITVNGTDTIWRDLEVMDTRWLTRVSAQSVSDPNDIGIPASIEAAIMIRAQRTQVINCILHDCKQGIEMFGVPGCLIYGTLIYNQGWTAPDRGHGHALYSHNNNGGLQTIESNMLAGGYGYNLHLYSQTNNIRDYNINSNCLVNADNIISSIDNLTSGIDFEDNRSFFSSVKIGYQTPSQSRVVNDIQAIGNWVGGIGITYGFEIQRSTAPVLVIANRMAGLFVDDYFGVGGNWDFNEYWQTRFFWNDGPVTDLAGWQVGTGHDLHSTGVAGLPTANWVDIIPNTYDPTRALVVIYNWANDDAVSVDLSELDLELHSAYRLYNIANMAEWQEFIYTGESEISIQMTSWTVAIPIMADEALYPSTFPMFGAFILQQAATETVYPRPHGTLIYRDVDGVSTLISRHAGSAS